MIASTFARYMTRAFCGAVFSTFLSAFGLVLIIDFVEQLRRVDDAARAPTHLVALLTFYRVPAFVEVVLPFAVLVGAMLCFLSLSRKLELVVARSAGISAWQFLTPALVVAALIGVFSTTIYNPMAAEFRERSLRMERDLFGRAFVFDSTTNFWLRQATPDGQSVMNAATATERGRVLAGVTALVYGADGRFRERIDAEAAELEQGAWRLAKARVTPLVGEPEVHETLMLPTRLTADQVRQALVTAELISFWELPSYIALARVSGMPASRFELQYHLLLARPLLLMAMVLVAAAASLRFARLGGVGRTILGGVVAGFLLYVGSELAGNLGRSGFVSPMIAAWSPAFIGALMGFMALLKQEDG